MHHIILNIAFNNCFLFYVFKLSGPDKLSEMFNVIIVTMIVAKLDVFRFGRFAAQGSRLILTLPVFKHSLHIYF